MGVELLPIVARRRSAVLWGLYLLHHESDYIHARGIFFARRQGVEMMGLVMQNLQEQATKRRTPIVHEFTAVNAASLELIRQYVEYEARGKNVWGSETFERRYEP